MSLGAPTLQKLFEQKYVAQALDEQVETYNDLRRLKAMGEEYVILTNPRNTQSGINRYPERLALWQQCGHRQSGCERSLRRRFLYLF